LKGAFRREGEMAEREDVKRKRPSAQVTREDPATAAVISETPVEDLALSTRVLNVLTNAGVATVQDVLDILDGGEKIPGVADKTLEEIRNRLAENGLLELEDEKAEVERERQARLEAEQARAEPEMTLAEATKGGETERENTEPSLTAPGEKAERRVSFIVRLTVDEKGQPRRTEVQHAQSGNKEAFLALDVQRLAAFMEECARLPVAPEATVPPTRPSAKVEAPKPKDLTPESSLTVSDVRVFREGVPGVAALDFRAGEDLMVQAGFQIQGPEAPAFSAHEESFEVNVFAYEVTSGTSSLLSTHRDNLVENVLEYRTEMLIPELSPGIYRLTTLVRLLKMLDQHEGPIVHITGVRPSGDPVAPRESALSP
jgi:hypothetical protein